jgi:hypothetical protein
MIFMQETQEEILKREKEDLLLSSFWDSGWRVFCLYDPLFYNNTYIVETFGYYAFFFGIEKYPKYNLSSFAT